MTHQNQQNTRISPVSPDSGPGSEKNTLSEARRGAFSDPVDPQHPPRPKRRRWLLVLAAFVIVGVGRAAWPVIDISAIAQLVEAVNTAKSQLTEMTTAKEALLGQVAKFTGTWTSLTGDAYELGEATTGVVVTAKSLASIDTELLNRRNAEQLAWPTLANVQSAYAGADPAVITKVLTAHQTRSQQWNNERAAWHDLQLILASTGDFLEDVETTASTQNGETTQGLAAQLDRQIAVASSSRDIAAMQLQVAAATEHRNAQLEHQQTLEQAWRQQQELTIRGEIQTTIQNQKAAFDANSFDSSLFTPVLPSYKQTP